MWKSKIRNGGKYFKREVALILQDTIKNSKPAFFKTNVPHLMDIKNKHGQSGAKLRQS